MYIFLCEQMRIFRSALRKRSSAMQNWTRRATTKSQLNLRIWSWQSCHEMFLSPIRPVKNAPSVRVTIRSMLTQISPVGIQKGIKRQRQDWCESRFPTLPYNTPAVVLAMNAFPVSVVYPPLAHTYLCRRSRTAPGYFTGTWTAPSSMVSLSPPRGWQMWVFDDMIWSALLKGKCCHRAR